MDSSHELKNLEEDSQENRNFINNENKESNVKLNEESFSKLSRQDVFTFHNNDQRPCNGLIKNEESENSEIENVVKHLLINENTDSLNRFIEDDDGWDRCFNYLSELKLKFHNLNTGQSHQSIDANNIEISNDKLQKDILSKENLKSNNENSSQKTNEIKNKMIDLLQLYLILPVSVEMLKTNSAAKIIKHFIKSHYSDISSLAKEIIDKWMLKVSNKGKDSKKNKNQHASNNVNKTHKLAHNSDNSNQANSVYIHKSSAYDSPTHNKTHHTVPKQSNHKETKGFMDALTSSVNVVAQKPRKRPHNQKSIFKNEVDSSYKNNENNKNDYYVVDGKLVSAEECSSEKKEQPKTTSPSEKKVRKEVRFADELCSYFYFVVDESERVNVNKLMDFVEVRRHEIEMEYQMFQNNRKQLFGDTAVVDKQNWRRPMHISNVQQLVEWGCQSAEKKIQLAREQNVLQVIYFNKDMVPDYPEEADPEFQAITEPKIIPLSDITGINSEVLYEHTSSNSAKNTSKTITNTSSTTMVTVPTIPNDTFNETSHVNTTPTLASQNALTDNSKNNISTPPLSSTLATTLPSSPSLNTAWSPMFPMMPVMMDSARPPIRMPPIFPSPFLLPPHIFNPGNKPLCTHFLSGTCKFGTNCRNFHPPLYPPVIAPNVTNAPSMPPNSQLFLNNHSSNIPSKENDSNPAKSDSVS